MCIRDSYHSDHVGRIFCESIIFGCVDNACLIEAMETIQKDVHVGRWQAWHAQLKVVLESFYLLFLHTCLVIEVGLEILHQRVFLLLDGLICLINGEIEGGNE